jgi:hypothetical protein
MRWCDRFPWRKLSQLVGHGALSGLGKILSPIDIVHTSEETFSVVLFGKTPLVKTKVIVGFHEPFARPHAQVRMGF